MCIRSPLIHVNTGMEDKGAAHATKTIAAEAKTAYFERDTAGRPAPTPASDPNMVPSDRSIQIKQYAGRRLYHPAAGSYVTLDDLAVMVEDAADFTVRQAESGIDITSSILQQIIRKRALHG